MVKRDGIKHKYPKKDESAALLGTVCRFIHPLLKFQIPINLLVGWLDETSAGFVGVCDIFCSHGFSLSLSISCGRHAPQSEINAFIFYSGNNFDEICFTQWCLNQSANQGHWELAAGRWWRWWKRHLIKKNQSVAALPLRRGRINSSWFL